MGIFKDSDKTKYIADCIREEIKNGSISTGEKLLPSSMLARQYLAKESEVNKAINILKKEKLLVSFRRHGTFVVGTKSARTLGKMICVISAEQIVATKRPLYRGIEKILVSNGYDMIVKSTNNSQIKEEKLIKEALKNGVAGFIIEPSRSQIMCRHMNLYKILDEYKIPYVFIRGIYQQMTEKPRVYVDDGKGAYLLTRHLIATNRENIAGVFRADDNRGSERHRGYVNALQEAGLPYRPELVIWYHVEDSLKKPQSELDKILSEHKCDGIICYNDAMATNIMYHLFSKDYKVPQDIAVAGYGNTAVAGLGELGLTTITQPDELMGEMAAELLVEIRNGTPDAATGIQKVLNPEIVIRGSTVG